METCGICCRELSGDVYCGDVCKHLFHTKCFLAAKDIGAFGCPCCKGNIVNEFLGRYRFLTKETERLSDAYRELEYDLDYREIDTNGETNNEKIVIKYMDDNAYDIAKLRIMESELEEYKMDTQRYLRMIEWTLQPSRYSPSTESQSTECTICRYKLEGDTYSMIFCNHTYHVRCLILFFVKFGVVGCPCCGTFGESRSAGSRQKIHLDIGHA